MLLDRHGESRCALGVGRTTRKWRGREFWGLRGEEGGHDGMSEPSQHRGERVGRSWFASPNRGRDPGAEIAPPSRMRGARAGLNGGERSRAGDAFRPPSPAPFAFVTKSRVSGVVFTLTTAAGQEQFLSLTTCLRLAAEGVNRGGQVGVSMDWERPPCSENEGPLLTG